MFVPATDTKRSDRQREIVAAGGCGAERSRHYCVASGRDWGRRRERQENRSDEQVLLATEETDLAVL